MQNDELNVDKLLGLVNRVKRSIFSDEFSRFSALDFNNLIEKEFSLPWCGLNTASVACHFDTSDSLITCVSVYFLGIPVLKS